MTSPRATSDVALRTRFIAHQAECPIAKDFDHRQAPLDAQLATLTNGLQPIPVPGSAWLLG